MVAADAVFRLTDGDNVYTLAGLERHRPVVVGHTRHDMVAGQRPVRADAAVLYPDVLVVLGEAAVRQRILRKNAGMWLAVVVHDVTLVVDDVLDGNGRRYHFP